MTSPMKGGTLRLSDVPYTSASTRAGSNPETERRASAKLKLAQTLRSEGLEEDARRYVKELLAQYPDTKAADQAAAFVGTSQSAPPTLPASPSSAAPDRLSRPAGKR